MIIALSDVAGVIAIGLCIFGVIRLVRQFRIAKSYVSVHHDA